MSRRANLKRAASYVTTVSVMPTRDRGMADLATMDVTRAPEIEAVRSRAFRGLVKLVSRARKAGVLRRDFTTQDVLLLLMANAGLIERTHDISVQASARLMHLLLDGLRASAATEGPHPPDASATEEAMRRNSVHRLGANSRRTNNRSHGTKYALEALSDCLRLEVAPFAINVVVIEPGGIATEWGGIAADKLEETSGSGPYKAQADAVAKSLRSEATANRNSPPSVISDGIAKAVTAPRPKTRYAVGFGAKPLIAAGVLLSDRQFDALISRATGVPRT